MNTQTNRNCKQCGKSKHMRRVLDAQYGVIDVRYRVCFSCQPELESDDGDLKYYQDKDEVEHHESP